MPTPYPILRAIRPRRMLASHVRYLHSPRGSAPIRPVQLYKQLYRAQNRGKKTKASIKLDDLPQGVIPLDPLPLGQDAPPTYSTVVQQARTNMRKFENCVLLTRVGGFYELYFEHAEEFASLLNLKEARRPTRPGAPVVPMVNHPQSGIRTICADYENRLVSPSSNLTGISKFLFRILIATWLLQRSSRTMLLGK